MVGTMSFKSQVKKRQSWTTAEKLVILKHFQSPPSSMTQDAQVKELNVLHKALKRMMTKEKEIQVAAEEGTKSNWKRSKQRQRCGRGSFQGVPVCNRESMHSLMVPSCARRLKRLPRRLAGSSRLLTAGWFEHW